MQVLIFIGIGAALGFTCGIFCRIFNAGQAFGPDCRLFMVQQHLEAIQQWYITHHISSCRIHFPADKLNESLRWIQEQTNGR